MPWYIDFEVHPDIFEEAKRAIGDPRNARKALKCDPGEHTKVRAYVENKNGNKMATFVCEDCAENLVASKGNWVSQDDWTEDDWNAAQDWDKLRKDFKDRVSAKKNNRITAIRKMCKSRMQERWQNFEPPPASAGGQEWHEYLEGFRAGTDEWDRAYSAYLDSDWWASRRERVLDAKGRTCRIQYPGCNGNATEVHHKSYEMVGFEPLIHLAPVCRSCHEKLHCLDN